MPKAVIFDCYNTLLRYESQEDKERIWEMMKAAEKAEDILLVYRMYTRKHKSLFPN